jgi:hypothetical protein
MMIEKRIELERVEQLEFFIKNAREHQSEWTIDHG